MGLQSILVSPDSLPLWLDALAARIAAIWSGGGVPAKLSALKIEPRAQQEGDGRARPASSGRIASDDLLARFQRFVLPELDAAYNFARFLSRDADAAQDIVQSAFLRAYRGFDGYRGGDVRAWILTIVRNCYHDWLSDRRRKLGVEGGSIQDGDAGGDLGDYDVENVPSQEDTPEEVLLRKTESETVRRVLTLLPSTLREVLILREIEGFSYREIAQIAAVPIGTVMSRLARARRQFGETWQREADAQETRP